MYSEMHIWCYNIKNCYMKHSQNWSVYSFQIDAQAFTSSYLVPKNLSPINIIVCLPQINGASATFSTLSCRNALHNGLENWIVIFENSIYFLYKMYRKFEALCLVLKIYWTEKLSNLTIWMWKNAVFQY